MILTYFQAFYEIQVLSVSIITTWVIAGSQFGKVKSVLEAAG
jgi:hypothetical protein